MREPIRRVLTIAGSDSGGGAGIQADLKTFSAFGVYGMSVVTSVTAQNTVRVHGVEALSPEFVSLQFEAVYADIGVDSVKTGMLYDAQIVMIVAQKLYSCTIPNVVVDPVMVAKGGDTLLQKDAIEKVKHELLPTATLVTPNIPEAEILSGIRIESPSDLREAAIRIHKLGCGAVLIKGGHLKGDAVDVLFDGDSFSRFTSRRIATLNTHGTGCTYSAAIAAGLARGLSLKKAIQVAKKFVTRAIQEAIPLGKGHGPLNHFIRIEEIE
ncbi:bifunctional hydroxymethylpyrimidine kinase/phosphomethylpyrimidine kinase [bacterium]|nr:bifunctional hydroxymethylpyrimidine kinase/phosphomethylpyrimidine kinase [bacterium]